MHERLAAPNLLRVNSFAFLVFPSLLPNNFSSSLTLQDLHAVERKIKF